MPLMLAMEMEPLMGLTEVHLSGDASNSLSYPVGLILRQCCKLSEVLGTDNEFEHVGNEMEIASSDMDDIDDIIELMNRANQSMLHVNLRSRAPSVLQIRCLLAWDACPRKEQVQLSSLSKNDDWPTVNHHW